MKETNPIRNKWLTVRMSEDEYKRLKKYFDETTCHQLSDYVRRIVLNKPVSVKYRNVSIDEFLKDMLLLKKELNAIGNNINQSVHRLHMLDKVPEMQSWITSQEGDKHLLYDKIDQILGRVNQLYDQWLLK